MSSALSNLSALKIAALARDVREKALSVLMADPIAIVGMGCRAPGADGPDAFWDLVREGRTVADPVPADRWDVDAWYDAEPAVPGKSVTRFGSFVDQVDRFDAGYFNILPREADAMDPQQRLFLECAIEALDDAGMTAEALRGSKTGVFTAVYGGDYNRLSYSDVNRIDLRTLTGSAPCVVPNRLSYLLDLRGPSVALDTACSSSLFAIHMACQSLRTGDSDIAVTGGVSLVLTPQMMVALSKVGFMAPDGMSKAFDASADGFGRGEGCGVLVLRRLSDAIAAGDRIHALIRGSAVNQDGESTLLTAPNGPAQEDLIRDALENAQLDPGSISFIEAHGTGTALGDPIEVGAIAEVLGRPTGAPLYLGTAKANIGHLEAAAGVMGTIRAVLATKHRRMPPQPLFETLNPHIDLDGTRLTISREGVEFAPDTVIRGGISGFGVGGTNAHVIVEEAPRLGMPKVAEPEGPVVLALSVRDAGAVPDLAARWSAYLMGTDAPLADILYTAARRRTHHPHRVGVTGRTKAELGGALAALASSGHAPAIAQGTAGNGKLAMVFCGQGPQWFAMGRDLAQSDPAFAEALKTCAEALAPHWDTDLLAELNRSEEDSRLAETRIAQPALFSIQVALARMWQARGITPQAVTGHSIGEIAALHIAGVLDLATAARIVANRGRIMQEADGSGAMASVALSEDEAAKYATGALCVAAVNGPRTCVLSGAVEALDEAVKRLEADKVEVRRLPVRYAFHSPQMDPFVPDLTKALSDIATKAPTLDFRSTVSGARMQDGFTAEYFAKNMRNPVRFAASIERLVADGYDCFLEIGPHPVLGHMIAETAGDTRVAVVPSLRRQVPEEDTVARATAALWAAGVSPDWKVLAPTAQVTSLPAYPWQRQRHWLADGTDTATVAEAPRLHPFLARKTTVAGDGTVVFDGDALPGMEALSDHVVLGHNLMPGAGLFEGFLAAARALLGSSAGIVDASVLQPVDLTDGAPDWQIVARPDGSGGYHLEWFVQTGTDWQLVARAETAPAADPAPQAPLSLPGPGSDARFRRSGVEFGPAFSLLSDIRTSSGTATARAETQDTTRGYWLNPAILDAAFQLSVIAAEGEIDAPARAPVVPIAIERLWCAGPLPAAVTLEARVTGRTGASLTADLRILDDQGTCLAEVTGLQSLPAETGLGAWASGKISYTESWVEAPATGTRIEGNWIAIDLGGSARTLRGSGILAADATVLDSPGNARRWAETEFDTRTPPAGVLLCCDLDTTDAQAVTGSPDRLIHALHAVQAILQACPDAPPVIHLVTRQAQAAGPEEPGNPDAASLWGAMANLAAEHPELGPRCIDLDAAATISALTAEAARTAPQTVALRGASRLTPQFARADLAPRTAMTRLEPGADGTLDGVAQVPFAPAKPGAGEVLIEVRASALNFRDVLIALGAYPGEKPPFGTECCGIVIETGEGVTGLEPGDRVMGLAPFSHATRALAKADQVIRVPEGIPDAQAAATPIAFLTASLGLERMAGIGPGKSVLIHSAAGGVGLAALQIAVASGAEVYATAGSEEKRALVKMLGALHVFDSRKLDFAEEILGLTGGRGVDIVLNSLADDFIPASLATTAADGWFLELGKRGILSDEEAHTLRPDVNYAAYDLGQTVDSTPGLFRELARSVLDRLSDGTLAHLPVREFPMEDAFSALRYMAEARHVGKIVLRASHAPFAPDPEGVYWITGGLGAIGRDAARWLARAGARRIVLSGRKDPGPEAQAVIDELEAGGVMVSALRTDVSDVESLKRARDLIRGYGPLRGVLHAAGTLRDAAFLRQSAEDATDVTASKFGGAAALHEVTRGDALDFFVLLSSAGQFLGGTGQTAYAAANAGLDALARWRRAQGLPALSVALGPWPGGGMAQSLSDSGNSVWDQRGVPPLVPTDAFAAFERLIAHGDATAMVARVDWPAFLDRASDGVDRIRFAPLASGGTTTPAMAEAPAPQTERTLPDRLRELPDAARPEALVEALADLARSAIGLSASTPLPPKAALKDLGLDSLMSVEFRNLLVRAGGTALPVTLLFDYPTLEDLAGHLGKVWDLTAAPETPPASDLDDLSDDDALALLERELAGDGGTA